jgi:hypothetical protein
MREPLRYHDFPIEIGGDAGTAQVRVLGSVPGGEMSGDETVEVAVEDAGRTPLDPQIARLQRRKAERDELIALGARLGQLLLPGRVRELFEASRAAVGPSEGLRLRLRVVPAALAAIPWEYALVQGAPGEATETDFLALQPTVSIVRQDYTGAPLPPRPDADTLRMVVALANPVGDFEDIDVEKDRQAIEQAIAAIATGQAIELEIVRETTSERLLTALGGTVDVFHFAGHGVFEGAEFGDDGTLRARGSLILETTEGTAERFDGGRLAALLSAAGTRLAILGACESATRDDRGAWSGIAPALVRANIPSAVAMQFRIEDANTSLFIAHLYANVLAGSTIDEAVGAGRRAILSRGGLTQRDWGVPVLYLRAQDGLLLEPLPAESPDEASRETALIQVRQGFRRITETGESIGVDIEGTVPTLFPVKVDQEIGEVAGKVTGVRIRAHRHDSGRQNHGL